MAARIVARPGPAALALLAVAALAAGCGHAASAPSSTTPGATVSPTTVPPTTVSPTTVPPTTVPPTTTTTALPAQLQASDDAAGSALVAAWQAGDRSAARAVAVPRAVGQLFSAPYPSAGVQARGCTTGADPATCTYADLAAGSLLEITVRHAPGGWYVSAVVRET